MLLGVLTNLQTIGFEIPSKLLTLHNQIYRKRQQQVSPNPDGKINIFKIVCEYLAYRTHELISQV